MKRILLTTANRRREAVLFNYFYVENDGKFLWGDELYPAEAVTKLCLERFEIDQIIFVGYDEQCEGLDETCYGFDTVKAKLIEYSSDVKEREEELFRRVDERRREELMTYVASFWNTNTGDILEHIVHNKKSWNEFIEQYGPFTFREIKWIQRYLYMSVSEDNRLEYRLDKIEADTSFVPIVSTKGGTTQLTEFDRLVKEIKCEPGEKVDIYVAMGGLKPDDAYILVSMFGSVYENRNMNISLEKLSGMYEVIPGFLNKIYDASDRIVSNRLNVGLKAFINNGRTDIIRAYWESTGIENEHINKIMEAMSTVESGMLLCNMVLIKKGILGLKAVANEEYTFASDVKTEEEVFLKIVKSALVADCKPLVKEGTYEISLLELIRWMFQKGFYQQAITIIESKIPEDMALKGFFYPYETEEEKEAYMKAFNAAYWKTGGRNRWMFNDIYHYFMKNYGKGYTNSVYRNDPSQDWDGTVRASQVFSEEPMGGLLPAHSIIENEEHLRKILDLYFTIGRLRNSVHHGECKQMKEPFPVYLHRTISEFLELYTIIEENAKDINFTAIPIASKEFKAFFLQNGPRENPEFDKVPGFVR